MSRLGRSEGIETFGDLTEVFSENRDVLQKQAEELRAANADSDCQKTTISSIRSAVIKLEAEMFGPM